MRYIVFSDLHSNLEALLQFEKEIASITYDRLVCLGDIVGYGADPNLCVDWVRKNVDFTIAGNHDFAAQEKYAGPLPTYLLISDRPCHVYRYSANCQSSRQTLSQTQ